MLVKCMAHFYLRRIVSLPDSDLHINIKGRIVRSGLFSEGVHDMWSRHPIEVFINRDQKMDIDRNKISISARIIVIPALKVVKQCHYPGI